MRVTHFQDQHLLALSRAEASELVDACALLLTAASSVPECPLTPAMGAVLLEVFGALAGAPQSCSDTL